MTTRPTGTASSTTVPPPPHIRFDLMELVRGFEIAAAAAEHKRLLRRLRRVHYPPQIGTHPPGTLYEQGFADCLRAVLAEFRAPQ